MQVQLEKITKTFAQNGDTMTVLKDLDLSIEEGQFVCLVGPSGCGKSSLINLIAGLEKPSAGQVLVEGKSVEGPSPERMVVFQESALFPWMTVRANVEFGLKVKGMPPEQRREQSEKYLKMVHLSRFADARPHQLSGGMKQRVAIARALATEPKILLMDEPFGALDAQTRILLHKELVQIWQRTHKTIFFVTHNVREATVLGDVVLEMSARPARIKKGYRIRLPRPRREGDPHLGVIQQRIMLSLQEEIAKVMKDEGLDHLVEKKPTMAPLDPNLADTL